MKGANSKKCGMYFSHATISNFQEIKTGSMVITKGSKVKFDPSRIDTNSLHKIQLHKGAIILFEPSPGIEIVLSEPMTLRDLIERCQRVKL